MFPHTHMGMHGCVFVGMLICIYAHVCLCPFVLVYLRRLRACAGRRAYRCVCARGQCAFVCMMYVRVLSQACMHEPAYAHACAGMCKHVRLCACVNACASACVCMHLCARIWGCHGGGGLNHRLQEQSSLLPGNETICPPNIYIECADHTLGPCCLLPSPASSSPASSSPCPFSSALAPFLLFSPWTGSSRVEPYPIPPGGLRPLQVWTLG